MSNIYQSKHKGQTIDQTVVDTAALKSRMTQAETDIQYLNTQKANANTVPKSIKDLEPNASLVYMGKNEPPSHFALWVCPIDNTLAVLKARDASGNWVNIAGGGSNGEGGVYIGSGEMPDDCNVQIDPDGDAFDVESYVRLIISGIQGTKITTINLLSSAWVKESDNQYSQIVSISGITERSKVDLQPTTEQLFIFYEKDITFVAENDDGVVTVYCIGQKPTNDYSMQATITEVDVNG